MSWHSTNGTFITLHVRGNLQQLLLLVVPQGTSICTAGLTSDVLVLFEPGTPAGSATIQEARAAVLQREQRRLLKLRSRLPTGTNSSGHEDPTKASKQQPDHNLQQKTTAKAFGGAHVVAPCPHDGACPLAMPGTKAWCHFGTRFQRPAFMQAVKATRGSRANPSDHQDERYSYVVLR